MTDPAARLSARFTESPHPLLTDSDFDDVRAVLDELWQLRDEVDFARHDAKRCTARYRHRLFGVRRCELPSHGRSGHFAELPGGWVKWDDASLQQPERDQPRSDHG